MEWFSLWKLIPIFLVLRAVNASTVIIHHHKPGKWEWVSKVKITPFPGLLWSNVLNEGSSSEGNVSFWRLWREWPFIPHIGSAPNLVYFYWYLSVYILFRQSISLTFISIDNTPATCIILYFVSLLIYIYNLFCIIIDL